MTKSSTRILSNSTLLMGAEISSRIIRIALVVFAARLLGDEDYGKFSFALSFTSLFLIFADMGIHQLIVREVARKPGDVTRFFANALVIKIILAVFDFLLVFTIINLTNKPYEIKVAVYILTAYQIVISFNLLFRAIFQAFEKMKYDAIVTILQSMLDTTLGVGILLLGGNFHQLALMYLIGSIIIAIYCLIVIAKKFTPIVIKIEIPLIRFLIKEGLPFGILFFFAMMYNYVSSVILSFMTTDEIVGWYMAAYRLVFAVLFIPTGTMRALFPVLSRNYKESLEKFKSIFKQAFKFMFFLGVSIAVLTTLLADKIVLLLYGQEYANSAPILRILIWSIALIFITTLMTHTTRASDRQRFTAKVVAFSAVLNVVLNLILIPKFSYKGAAFAAVATEASTFLFHFFYLNSKIVKPPLLKLAPKIVIINLVVIAYVLAFYNANIFLLAPSALLVNLIMVYSIQYFSKDEILILKEVIHLKRH